MSSPRSVASRRGKKVGDLLGTKKAEEPAVEGANV
jgi:hypothetical protein